MNIFIRNLKLFMIYVYHAHNFTTFIFLMIFDKPTVFRGKRIQSLICIMFCRPSSLLSLPYH